MFPAIGPGRGRIGWDPPDRGEQERAERLQRRIRWAKPVGTTAVGIAAVPFVVAPTHPVSIALYVVGAVGLMATLAALEAGMRRLREANTTIGIPVPANVVETASETELQLTYLDEELTFWRRSPGVSGLRRRLNRQIDAFRAVMRELRATWVCGDDEGWRRAGRRVTELRNGLLELSVAVTLLPRGGRRF